MDKATAERLVDKWAKDFRTYLEGPLHRVSRQGLVEAILAATADDGPELADELADSDGLTAAQLRDVAARAIPPVEPKPEPAAEEHGGRCPVCGSEGDAVPVKDPDSGELVVCPHSFHDEVARQAIATATAPRVVPRPAKPDDEDAAADALAVLQEVAREGGFALQLTAKQVERFTLFGLLEGVNYVTTEPLSTSGGVMVDDGPETTIPGGARSNRRRR